MIIYSAKNKINGKRYIGQTTQVLYNRKKQHKFNAKKYGDKYPLYKAVNEDGWDNFEWEVLEELNDNISQEELDERECYWIEYYNSVNEGYNCQVGGQSGYYHTDETRELISKMLMFFPCILYYITLYCIKKILRKDEHKPHELFNE